MKKLIFLLVIGGSFFIFGKVLSVDTDIIINEISAYPTSTHEWVEIWNKGSETIDLNGWKFWENNTNHGLVATNTDSLISPGEYAVIVQDAHQFIIDYSNFSGSIFDSSWGSLTEQGEEIGLKDASGNFVEKFTYLATPNHHALERKNPYLVDYTFTNWQEHPSGDTLGIQNSNFDGTIPSPSPPPGGDTADQPTSTFWSQIKLNEFVSNPNSSNEWVEIYNMSTSSLDLSGGYLCDSHNTTSTCKSIAGTISAGVWLIVDLGPAGYLNNEGGDSVILKNPDGSIVDQIFYSGATVPDKGQSLARRVDGTGDWTITTQLTPNAANIIVAPVVSSPPLIPVFIPSPPASAVNLGSPAVTEIKLPPPTLPAQIILNEFYPDPPGPDLEGEFIEIRNTSTIAVSLSGWKLTDSVKSFSLYGTINPGQIVVWPRQVTGIALNNTSKEEVKLLSPSGLVVDKVSYNKAVEGQSYGRDETGSWQWSNEPTPGLSNTIGQPASVGLVWKVNVPKSLEVGEMAIFEAEDTADPRGGSLIFEWNLGDGTILSGGEVEHAYATSGVFSFTVTATSTSGAVGERKMEVVVGRNISVTDIGVMMTEVFPNPPGADSREFIEVYNSSSSTVDLSGWFLSNKSKKTFVLPPGTLIQPRSFLIFYKAVTRLSLNNSGDKVELLTPNKESVDAVKFGKSQAGKSYSLIDDEWRWVEEPTPGAPPSEAQIIDPEAIIKVEEEKKVKANKSIHWVKEVRQARDFEKGDILVLRGVVSVPPKVFSSQFFYLADETAGMQIYMYKKDFPDLKVGDWAEVRGVISEVGGVKRINVKSKGDIKILAAHKPVPVAPITSEEIDEELVGELVKLKGEITEIKTAFMYVDDGNNEVKISFKRGAGIDKQKFKEGENVEIVGLLESRKDGWQVAPRSTEDITSLGPSDDLLKKQAFLNKNSQSGTTTEEKYLKVTIGGLSALFLGFLARARGALAKNLVKRVALAAAGIIKKGKV